MFLPRKIFFVGISCSLQQESWKFCTPGVPQDLFPQEPPQVADMSPATKANLKIVHRYMHIQVKNIWNLWIISYYFALLRKKQRHSERRNWTNWSRHGYSTSWKSSPSWIRSTRLTRWSNIQQRLYYLNQIKKKSHMSYSFENGTLQILPRCL